MKSTTHTVPVAPRRAASRGSATGILVTVLFAGTALVAAWWIVSAMASDAAGDRGVLYHTVTRGDMLITVTDDGTLESAANVDIKCELAGGGTILWIVEDGKEVEEGEKLVEMDTAQIEDQYNLQKSITAKARATKIQSEQTLSAAEKAVREYKEGTYLQELQTADALIIVSQQNMSSAQSTLEYTQRMVRKGFATPTQLEADEFAVKHAELDLATAKLARKVLEEFTNDKMVGQLDADVEAARAFVEADVATLENEEAHRELLEKQMDRAEIFAPKRGMVVYANERRGRYGSGTPDIEEGAQVRDRQTILQLPDLSQMQVVTTVHESKVNQVNTGLAARVVIQDTQYTGRVIGMANQPEPISFLSANVKEYATTVSIDGAHEGLRPGMTAEVEILIAELTDVVTLPVTAIVEKRAGFFCYLKTPTGYEERRLELGLTNDTFIEIKDGVKEGDEVIRNPRAVVPEAREEVPLEERATDRSQFGDSRSSPSPSSASPGKPPAAEDNHESPPATERSGPPSASQIIAQADTDDDGQLSKDEVPERMRDNFDQIDGDGDGFITASELSSVLGRFRGAGGGERGERGESGSGDQP